MAPKRIQGCPSRCNGEQTASIYLFWTRARNLRLDAGAVFALFTACVLSFHIVGGDSVWPKVPTSHELIQPPLCRNRLRAILVIPQELPEHLGRIFIPSNRTQ